MCLWRLHVSSLNVEKFPFGWPASVSKMCTVRKWAEPKVVGRNFTSRIRPMTRANHHYIVLCIGMNDSVDYHCRFHTHKHIIIYINPFSQSRQQIMFALQLSSHMKHYQLSLHASSLCSIMSFQRGCLLFGFHFMCVYVAFCLVLLFRVAFGTPYVFACAFNPIIISILIG